jgi:hypothetical protein
MPKTKNHTSSHKDTTNTATSKFKQIFQDTAADSIGKIKQNLSKQALGNMQQFLRDEIQKPEFRENMHGVLDFISKELKIQPIAMQKYSRMLIGILLDLLTEYRFEITFGIKKIQPKQPKNPTK